MNKNRWLIVTMLTVAIVALVIAFGMTSCSSAPPPDPCQINPTKQTATGEWVEWDDEPLDADPCDSDDLSEAGHRKPVVKNTPATKQSSPKPATGNQPRK